MHKMFRAIRRVMEEHPDVKAIYSIHMNPVVRKAAEKELGDLDRIRIIEPLEVLDFHNFLARSYMILTDSGGTQEEAPSLGKPVLVMRDTTERPEGIKAGSLKLVGTDEDIIYKNCKLLLENNDVYDTMEKASNPYGDGLAVGELRIFWRDKMSLFTNKTLLITGGTGSFGNAVLNRFLRTDIGEIHVFSRDEKKQDDMRHEFQAKMPEVAEKIKFYIGDVRDIASVKNAMHGVDYIFHAAALKQVPSCEFFPIEAVKTNVLGTENVLTAAIEAGVKNIVCLSTDKAAYPVNAMGTSKAMMEKVIVAKSRTVSTEKTKICCTRYGNVMCSRGSVIPLWIDQIRAGKPITITDPTMTRFIMSLEEAVDLVLFAFEYGESGDILVQKAPACTIQTQAEAVCELFGGDKDNIKVIGIRHGEKMYETLLTNEECANAIDLGNFYRVPCDKRGLNYDKYFNNGDVERNPLTEFNSNNTQLLSVEETKAKIASLQYIQDELKK